MGHGSMLFASVETKFGWVPDKLCQPFACFSWNMRNLGKVGGRLSIDLGSLSVRLWGESKQRLRS